MSDLSKLTDAEFYVECADVVHHFATQVMTIARETASLCRRVPDDRFGSANLEFSMRWMLESLRDLLSDMDAVTSDDDWVNPIYEELHRRFPKNSRLLMKTEEMHGFACPKCGGSHFGTTIDSEMRKIVAYQCHSDENGNPVDGSPGAAHARDKPLVMCGWKGMSLRVGCHVQPPEQTDSDAKERRETATD